MDILKGDSRTLAFELQRFATLNNDTNNKILNGTSDADKIYSYGSLVTINAGDGNDELVDNGSLTAIDAGAGNDTIYNCGGKNTINAGSGNDSVGNFFQAGSAVDYLLTIIDLGEGNDSVSNYNRNVLIDADDGNDYIFNGNSLGLSSPYGYIQGSLTTIRAGAGNDTIKNYGIDVTIDGGKGNDRITLSGSRQLIQYAAGDGYDTIIGFSDNDTINITDGSEYGTIQSGNDITVYLDEGSVLLKNAVGKAVNIVGGSFVVGYKLMLNASDGNDTINNSKANMTINAGVGDDSIKNIGASASISGGTGNDYIFNAGYVLRSSKNSVPATYDGLTTIDTGSGTTIIGGVIDNAEDDDNVIDFDDLPTIDDVIEIGNSRFLPIYEGSADRFRDDLINSGASVGIKVI